MGASSSNASLRGPIVAILLPLLSLAALAAMGSRAQLRAAWDEASQQAGRLAGARAKEVAAELAKGVVTLPVYADPPALGTESEADAILDGGDLAALLKLRDDPQAGLSPAGLPRQALAAMRVQRLDPAAQDSEAFVQVLTERAPSVLTRPALARIAGAEAERQFWDERETLRDLAEAHPEAGAGGLWLAGPVWIGRQEGKLLALPAGVCRRIFAAGPDQGPAWASVRPVIEGTPDAGGGGRLLASAPVAFGSGLRLEVLADPRQVEAPARRQQRWTASMLIAAMAVAGGGLVLIQRILRRERQLSEMKSQFVASVSHELRAPVASIRLMADALEAEKVDAATAKEFHRLIAREGARLSTLVGNVLDHSRIEQGRKVWKRRLCDVTALVADTVRVMEPLAKEKNLTLIPKLVPLEAVVEADAIQQALVNLLDNAIKFSPAGSRITTELTIYGERRTWSLAVLDEGPGVPAAERERIFERFYRPGDELRRETQGAGIGLSLVKAIAEAHDGTARAGAGPAGEGALFTLTFPSSDLTEQPDSAK